MDKGAPRPRCYQSGTYHWRFLDIPATVEQNGKTVMNPARAAAVFVVHGMGDQSYLDTAVTLRNGFEEAIAELGQDAPTPLIREGYWGDYDEIEKTFPEYWPLFNSRERVFFDKLWRRRALSSFRTFRWFARQSLRLILSPGVFRKFDFVRHLTYLAIVPLGLLTLVLLLIRYPFVLSRVLNDVRLYLAPEGEVESAIVQRIDLRVYEAFLMMLGLDRDLRPLPENQRLDVSGEKVAFSYVTWLAHSLGSVISYNVISDLLWKCREIHQQCEAAGANLEPSQKELLDGVRQVEQGLHRSITIGSPLEKVAHLIPGALRPWPTDYYSNAFARGGQRRWWVNFYHVLDPVSGRMRHQGFFAGISNEHSVLWRIPGIAHVAYWHDIPILKFVVTRTYGAMKLDYPNPRFLSHRTTTVFRWVCLLLTAAAVGALLRWCGWDGALRLLPWVRSLL